MACQILRGELGGGGDKFSDARVGGRIKGVEYCGRSLACQGGRLLAQKGLFNNNV